MYYDGNHAAEIEDRYPQNTPGIARALGVCEAFQQNRDRDEHRDDDKVGSGGRATMRIFQEQRAVPEHRGRKPQPVYEHVKKTPMVDPVNTVIDSTGPVASTAIQPFERDT
ncbi:MAG TPA: hypothetical protein VFC18_12295 [Burkholderiales bacterium]|nr:hypothetical protein [Burkholderiales bacterium]